MPSIRLGVSHWAPCPALPAEPARGELGLGTEDAVPVASLSGAVFHLSFVSSVVIGGDSGTHTSP